MTSATAIQIRRARDADAKAVVDLLHAEELEVAFDPREFTVAHDGTRVVGSARLKPLGGGAHEIASVAVAPDARGQGVGERLVAAALARATGAVYALALAPGFFGKQGFEPMRDAPPELKEKAEGLCASTGFVPMRWTPSPEAAQAEIRRRYAEVAATSGSCCGSASDASDAAATDAAGSCCPREQGLTYSAEELAALPEGAHLGLGTGHPVREADPQPGETTLDLGSGAGVDVFLAARAVGPSGKAIGVDFTPEMVARARENARKGGFANVEFHESPIERLPLPDASVDAITSNCVINLSTDKAATLREALRVLKPGGRLVVSDTLRLPWTPRTAQPSCDCTTGALGAGEWKRALADAGFVDVDVRVTDAGDGRSVGAALVRARRP